MHIENCCRERDKYGYSQQQSKKSLVLHCRYLGSGRPWDTATAVHYLGFVAVQISVVPISHAPKGTNPISDEGRFFFRRFFRKLSCVCKYRRSQTYKVLGAQWVHSPYVWV